MSWVRDYLIGGDLRSLGRATELIAKINSQEDFDLIMQELVSKDRIVTMRAADIIEKVTIKNREYLQPYKKTILNLMTNAENIEFKWHLALLISRFQLTPTEAGKAWNILTGWALDKTESRIVRVNSIQSLYNISSKYPKLKSDLEHTFNVLENQNIPSLTARIKKLR